MIEKGQKTPDFDEMVTVIIGVSKDNSECQGNFKDQHDVNGLSTATQHPLKIISHLL